MKPVAEFYEQLKKEAVEDHQGDEDYYALNQGEQRTEERHRVIANALGKEIATGSLLDIGCGTGLFLETLKKRDQMPWTYVGTDIVDREESMGIRCIALGCQGFQFHLVPEGPPSLESILAKDEMFDVAVCIGITGFWGMHTYRSVGQLLNQMTQRATKGAIVFPRFYDPQKMGVEFLSRFDMQDMEDYCFEWKGPETFTFEQLEREFVLFWGV